MKAINTGIPINALHAKPINLGDLKSGKLSEADVELYQNIIKGKEK